MPYPDSGVGGVGVEDQSHPVRHEAAGGHDAESVARDAHTPAVKLGAR